jgi:serine O-acetyltransferase
MSESPLTFDVLTRGAEAAERCLRALLPLHTELDDEDVTAAIDGIGVGVLDPSQRLGLRDVLPEIRHAVELDIAAAVAIDPACHGPDEAALCSPGVHAVTIHRLAHRLWNDGLTLHARLLAAHARRTTAIDIHPGASIGRSFFIDHGVGVVIGETARVGNHVTIYQGVTLGAAKVERGPPDPRRHPTVEDHVTIYAGATILGGDTRIGAGSVIAAGVFLTESVPARHVVRRPRPDVELRARTRDLPLTYAI